MNANKLIKLIDSLTQDIEFSFQGVDGSICPFSRSDIAVCWNGKNKEYTSIDDMMNDTDIFGKSLNSISDELSIY